MTASSDRPLPDSLAFSGFPSFPEDFCLPSERSIQYALCAALQSAGLADGDEYPDAREIVGLPTASKVCFVLVDGFGLHNFEARSGHARTLRSFTALEPMTSIVPSTTAAAITALGTAATPGQTSMIGYSLLSPVSRRPFSLIKWDNTEEDPREWQKVPTLFEHMGQSAQYCRTIQPASHIDSGLSLCALRGLDAIAADSVDKCIAGVLRAFREGARFTYLYWGDVDKIGHRHGWTSQAWIEALEELDNAMKRLSQALTRAFGGETLLVLTADHGMVDVAERLDVADIPVLCEGVEITAGEERAVQVYTDEAEAVRERWANELGERALVITKDEAISAGLFGQTSEQTRERMGDVFAFMREGYALVDTRSRLYPHAPFQKGVHGSLTEYEMHVPLLVEAL